MLAQSSSHVTNFLVGFSQFAAEGIIVRDVRRYQELYRSIIEADSHKCIMFPPWRRCFSTRALSLAPATRLRCSQLLNNAKQLSAEQSNTPADHASLDGQEINVRGFVKSIRKQKKFAFAQIADGSTVEPIQAIFTAS
ncbi:asparaginyl-tRNA synthetase, partial [Ascosphaera atra]